MTRPLRRPTPKDHIVVCLTCGRLSAFPTVTQATGKFLAESHREIEPDHAVTVARLRL